MWHFFNVVLMWSLTFGEVLLGDITFFILAVFDL